MVLKKDVGKWCDFIDEWVAGASQKELSKSYPEFQPAVQDTGTKKGYRPLNLKDFIGQTEAVKDLIIQIESAKKRESPLNHVAFFGPPGLGKTTLARIVADEMGAEFSEITGHSITAKKVEAILLSLKLGDILFVDEIHAIKTKVAEMLYSPMQDFVYEGYLLPQFTLVGATTNLGKLPKPMRDRIVHQYVFTTYSMEEISVILGKHGVSKKVALYISQRAKGVPRHAVQFLIKIRGYVDKYNSDTVQIKHCREAFIAMQIDDIGMGPTDRQMVQFMYHNKAIGPASALGLDSIIKSMDITKEVYENMVEPYMLTKGLLTRTPRGRILTPTGMQYAQLIEHGPRYS